jgi:RNA-directed DNA polymerase
VVDADLKGYFDTIPHDRLMALVEGSISDGRVLSLIESFLHQDIVTEAARCQPEAGTLQGAVLSPLLANLYLAPLDLLMEQSGYRMVRYADDFVILCASEAKAQAGVHQVSAWVNANGLTLQRADRLSLPRLASREARSASASGRRLRGMREVRLDPDKTKVGDSQQPGQGFDFLGYRFEASTPPRGDVRRKTETDAILDADGPY